MRKLLIANRGEIACRIVRTCQQMGIATVAIYADADADALHVQVADEAVHVGASPATESYLNIENVMAVAQRTGADAIHPGYGFLAENATFAQAVLDAGLTWVGPQPEVIARMGDKREAKAFLQAIPYVPGYTGTDQSDEILISAADEIGYPIMIKATAGGGGKGMRAVESAEAMPDALAAARREASQAFGDDTLMLEKRLVNPRHIEVQIIGDSYGNVMTLGERECSIQRRHQKIIEESPAIGLDPDLRYDIHQTAQRVGEQLGYQNAGTVEFLLDSDGNFYFMEMNTRLQVEHPVTEAVYGIDLVRWQLEIADGAYLNDLVPLYMGMEDFGAQPAGHAIEVRVYAENPANNFLPVTGDVLRWQAPQNVRVDAGVQSGDSVSTHYDPMLAKVIAHASNRDSAIRQLDYALSQLQFLGMQHNVDFLRRVLTHDDHMAGTISTQFLDQHPDLMSAQTAVSRSALIATAFAKGGVRHGWRNNRNRPARHRFMHNENAIDVLLTPQRDSYLANIGDDEYTVILNSIEDNTYTLTVNGHRQAFTVVEGANDRWWVHSISGTVALDWQTPLPIPGARVAERGSLRAPMPGQVIAVSVEAGQTVEAGTVLLIIEAMKMEHRIEAPYAGTVEQIHYAVGDTVQQDDVLLAINTPDDEA